MRTSKPVLALLAACIVIFSGAGKSLALDASDFSFFERGAVDMGDIVEHSIQSAIARMSDSIKNKEMNSSSSLFTASMAMNWFAVRTVLFGVSGIEDVENLLTGENRQKYHKQIANVHAVAMLKNFTSDQQEDSKESDTIRGRLNQAIDEWNGDEPEELYSKLRPLFSEAYNGDMDTLFYLNQQTYSEQTIQPLVNDFEKLEVLARAAAKVKDVPGIDGSKGSLWERFFYIGSAILVLAFIVRLGTLMYNYSLGKMDDSAISDIIRYVLYYFIMASVPLICLAGIEIADGIKDMILGGNPEEQYELLRQTLELRSEYANLNTASSSFFSLPDLTGLVALVCSLLAQAVVYILLIMCDIMMAITIMASSLVIPLSLLPSFQDYLSKWIKAVVTFLFYPVAAAIYTVLMTAIVTNSFEMSALNLIVISICYLMGALKIPNIAEQMNGAVMASVATGLAMAPIKAVGTGLSIATGGIGTLGAKALNSINKAAKSASGKTPAT